MPIPKQDLSLPNLKKALKEDERKTKKLSFSLSHDEFVRFIFDTKRFAIAFLKAFLKPETLAKLDLENVQLGDNLLTDNKTYHRFLSDVSLIVPYLNKPKTTYICVQLEHKSFRADDYIIQLETYAALRHQLEYKKYKAYRKAGGKKKKHPLSRVIPFLLYNGRSANAGVKAFNELYEPLPGLDDVCLDFKPIGVNLRTIDIENIPNDPDCPELRFGLLALKLIFNSDPLTTVESLLNQIAEQIQRFNTTEDAVLFGQNLIRYFSNHTPKEKQPELEMIYNNFNKKTGGNKMRGAALVWYNKLIAEGKAVGIAEGKAEGKAEGEVRGKADSIVAILTRKYSKVPREVEHRIRAIQDPVVLESLLISAMESPSMDEFERCL